MISRLRVESFEENGITKWGLFYDEDGDKKHLTEDFKQVSFALEKDAKTKLEEIEEERRSEDAAAPFSVDDAKAFAESHKWKYASTYAKTAPHEYLVKRWLNENDRRQFERLVQAINKDAVTGYFYDHENKYLILGDYYYWYMPCYPENMAVDLINRTTTDYLEFRDGTYHYKPKTEEETKEKTVVIKREDGMELYLKEGENDQLVVSTSKDPGTSYIYSAELFCRLMGT